MSLRRLRSYLAAGPRPAEDAVLVLAADQPALETNAKVIDALTDGSTRVSLVIIAHSFDGRDRAAARFPAADVRVLPTLSSWFGFATLAGLRIRAVLALDITGMPANTNRLLSSAKRRGVPVFERSTNGLRALSASAEPFTIDDKPNEIAAHIARAVGTERLMRWSPDQLAAALHRSLLSRVTTTYVTQIQTREALAAELGHPQTLLCLGNGPSGTDPRLAEIEYDTLFRVNHDWRSNGYLDKPDMVFAGVKRSMRRMGRTPLGVATERKAHALSACRLLEPWHGPARFTVVEDIAKDVIPPVTGPLRPTTGAYMLAAAVALTPQRVVIAGMDMFRDERGAYAATNPDAASEVNAYTPSHDYDTDAAFIVGCLKSFNGEVIVYSKALVELLSSAPGPRPYTLTDRANHD